MKLVVVESPAKCAKIRGFLGDSYKVVASFGHIRALEHDLDAVGIERDFEPKYTFLTEKKKVTDQLKDAAKGCTEVYLAADDDREGEAIAFSVCLLLKLNPATTPRAVFHEITKKAVCEAVANPRCLDMNKVFAQQSRAMLDMLIGFTLSPLLWRHVSRGLSAGRCQTPALRLIAEKEKTVGDFKSSLTWKMMGSWTDNKGTKVAAELCDELEDEESAHAYIEIVRDAADPYKIKSVVVRPWTTSPPPPLITSTLQQQASALFGMSPKTTMSVAQRLYEEGYITYMRTDSAVLSEEAVTNGRKWIEENYGADYLGGHGKAVAPTAKKTAKKSSGEEKKDMAHGQGVQAQEAHEAIRPTNMDLRELDEDVGNQERKLYELIWRRAMQSLMSDARGESKTAKFGSISDADFEWVAKWSRTLFAGWKKLGEVGKINDDADDNDGADESWNDSMKVGDVLRWQTVTGKATQTKAPSRYTEASLVSELEKRGIGRPSTYAGILDALSDKAYIEIKDVAGQPLQLGRLQMTADKVIKHTEEKVMQGGEKKKMVPTELGVRALAFLEREFSDLIDYSFTAHMENSLDKIAKGEEEWKGVLRGTWSSYSARYNEWMTKSLSAEEAAKQKETNFSAKVKQLGEFRAVQSKKGPLLLKESPDKDPKKTIFYGWPKGISFSNMTEAKALAFIEEIEKQKEERENSLNLRLGGESVGAASPHSSLTSTGGKTDDIITLGKYIFKNGPYGPYMYNSTLKTKVFVPTKGVDAAKMTEKEADAFYKVGVEKKKSAKKFYAANKKNSNPSE
jgi:DNA topoisomerase-1